MVPFAPLLENLGLAIGVLTYNGKLFWGVSADADRLPDLADFRVSIERAFARLADAAGVKFGQAPRWAVPSESRAEIAPEMSVPEPARPLAH